MILFYHGEDTFTLYKEINNLKSQSPIVETLAIRDQSDSALKSQLVETINSQGLFASKKLVLLKDFVGMIQKFSQSEEWLTEFIKNESAGETLVVFEQTEGFDKRLKFFKAVSKSAKTREFIVPRGPELAKWVSEYLGEYGFRMESAAVQEFVMLMGQSEDEMLYDLWQVRMELEKLMLLRVAEKTISSADVRELVKPNVSENIFALTNLFAEGKTVEAAALLEKMVNTGASTELKTASIQIIGGLASQIRSLLLVKSLEGKSSGEIAKTLGWKEGRVWINAKLAKKFTREKLTALLSDLRALDLRLKSSEEPPKLLLTLFFQKAKV